MSLPNDSKIHNTFLFRSCSLISVKRDDLLMRNFRFYHIDFNSFCTSLIGTYINFRARAGKDNFGHTTYKIVESMVLRESVR